MIPSRTATPHCGHVRPIFVLFNECFSEGLLGPHVCQSVSMGSSHMPSTVHNLCWWENISCRLHWWWITIFQLISILQPSSFTFYIVRQPVGLPGYNSLSMMSSPSLMHRCPYQRILLLMKFFMMNVQFWLKWPRVNQQPSAAVTALCQLRRVVLCFSISFWQESKPCQGSSWYTDRHLPQHHRMLYGVGQKFVDHAQVCSDSQSGYALWVRMPMKQLVTWHTGENQGWMWMSWTRGAQLCTHCRHTPLLHHHPSQISPLGTSIPLHPSVLQCL